jgi:hypothetical protein
MYKDYRGKKIHSMFAKWYFRGTMMTDDFN